MSWTHSNCGGVSSASGIRNYVGRSCTPLLALPNRPRRQFSSILSTTKGGWATPHPAQAPWPPQVTFTSRSGCHGDGLFPAESADPWVDPPDCLSSTGWARRKMTPEELLTAADTSVDLQDSLFHRSGIIEISLMLRSPIGMLHLLGVQLTAYLRGSPKASAIGGLLCSDLKSDKPALLTAGICPSSPPTKEDCNLFPMPSGSDMVSLTKAQTSGPKNSVSKLRHQQLIVERQSKPISQ